MSHNNQPEYYTINAVCPHDGTTTSIGIFEDMDAVAYRLKRMYTTCGDEYRIECHHLSTAESEAVAYNEQVVSRTEYKRKEAEKEAKLKEYDEWKGQIDYEKNLEEAIESHLETKLPDIKAEYKTVEAA
jgi:hypothetical protein